MRERLKWTFLMLFGNPVWKYLIWKIISCMQWLFWVIKLKRDLGPAFGAHFQHDFLKSISYLILYELTKVSMSYLLSFWRCQTKCVIKFIFRQLIKTWSLKLIFDHPLNQWLKGTKRGEDDKIKTWKSFRMKRAF